MPSRFRLIARFCGAVLTVAAHSLVAVGAGAQNEPYVAPQMTLDRITELIFMIDPEAEQNANVLTFTYNDQSITLVADPTADRMRMVIGIMRVDDLTEALKHRLLQANFDSALDARYAIAQEILWATYIHPLSPLTDDEFISGLSQTISLVTSFGTTFSSGLFTFGGGDSQGLLEELLELLRRQNEKPV